MKIENRQIIEDENERVDLVEVVKAYQAGLLDPPKPSSDDIIWAKYYAKKTLLQKIAWWCRRIRVIISIWKYQTFNRE